MTNSESFEKWLDQQWLTEKPVKRSVTIAGHSTSISLEPAFWEGLQTLAHEQELSVAGLIALVDRNRGLNGLPSALRQMLYAQRLTFNGKTIGTPQSTAE